MKKITWMTLSILMVAALVLGSCAPAPTAEPGPGAPAPGAEMVKNAAGKMVEKPRYGGEFIGGRDRNPVGFDDGYAHTSGLHFNYLTNEELYVGDWAKGSQGTGEAGFQIQGTLFMDYSRPRLATGWELVDGDTIVYHIRKGVHYHDKPPVNGRELNAQDIAFSVKRAFELKTHYLFMALPKGIESVTTPDDWTVVIKAPEATADIFSRLTDCLQIVPPELGYEGYKDWENVVGTGPFMLTDYVPDSSGTLVRNPNYWATDPLHPENKLPYVDKITWLIIKDVSTRIAAMRTAKLDWLIGVSWEDAASLHKTNPDLQSVRYAVAAHGTVIWMRTDVKPFDDIRVRRALNMAVDNKVVMDEYYGGNAVLLSCPYAPYPEFMNIYTPLEEQPRSVQELYEYHPDKAKQLLAEAGYPDGFKSEILCNQNQVDLISIAKDYWSKIGVDVELDVKELAVWRSTAYGGKHEAMVMQHLSSVAVFRWLQYRPGLLQNFAMVDDEYCNKVYEIIEENVVFNEAEALRVLKEAGPYVLDQAWMVEMPTPILEKIWQPWVKGYGGEWTVGYSNAYNFPIWLWVDQDLKKSMGH